MTDKYIEREEDLSFEVSDEVPDAPAPRHLFYCRLSQRFPLYAGGRTTTRHLVEFQIFFRGSIWLCKHVRRTVFGVQ